LGSFANKFLDADADGQRDSASPTATVPLENISALWNGGTILWNATPASRTIFTSIDGFSSIKFDAANQAALMPYLRAADASESQNIINWVRGDDLSGITDAGHASGYRKRDLTINGVSNIWKLGDIVNSTPSIVARPMENFDLLYGDSTYSKYRLTHLKRRHMVYAGANDGMLHAFNAGCFDPTLHKYFPDVDAGGNCTSSGHSLGEELWSFIPRGVLPHLKWNTDPDYTHVYYVDSKPKITDIKVFTANAAHSNGWGTVLIGGFRYGGKDISWTSGGTSYSASPEYFALDVTDPLNPRLLWTFSDPGLGLSMSYPAITKIGDKWYAIFGSGATDYDERSNLTAYQSGYLYVLDISGGTNGVIDTWTLNSNFWKIATGNATSFTADPISVDVDIDYDVDVMYIGENYQQGNTWNALMHRITTGSGSLAPSAWTISTLGNINSIAGNNDSSKRITAAPSAAMDDRANMWLFFGTGQFLGLADKNQDDTGAFYAIKDGCWNGSCTTSYSNLIDVSTATVSTGGIVAGISGGCGAGSSTWGNLLTASYSCDGWSMYFETIGESVDFAGNSLTHTGERMLSKPLVLGGLVTFATYIPGINECSYEGESNVYAVYYETGTAYNEYVFKEQKDDAAASTTVGRVRKLGAGMPSSLSAQVTAGGTAKGFVQQSTGSILEIESVTPIALQSGVTGWKNEAIQ
jgi:type IV pilus assembly protein PilY1